MREKKFHKFGGKTKERCERRKVPLLSGTSGEKLNQAIEKRGAGLVGSKASFLAPEAGNEAEGFSVQKSILVPYACFAVSP